MKIAIHPHAAERMSERGITTTELTETIETGEQFEAKYGRRGFRKDFRFDNVWRDRRYGSKQVEAYTVQEGDTWIVITVLAKYY